MWNFDFKILIRIEDRVEGEKEKKGVAFGQLLFGYCVFYCSISILQNMFLHT